MQPPDYLDDHQQLIWKSGYMAALSTIHDLTGDYMDELSPGAERDDGEERCADCGTELIPALGGWTCPNCTETPDTE